MLGVWVIWLLLLLLFCFCFVLFLFFFVEWWWKGSFYLETTSVSANVKFTSFFFTETNVSVPGETANPNSATSGNFFGSCTKIWRFHKKYCLQIICNKNYDFCRLISFHLTLNPAEFSGPKKYSSVCSTFIRSQSPPAVPVVVVFRECPK